MNREDVHRAWAPSNERWCAWVKPVLFANLEDEELQPGPPPLAPAGLGAALVAPLVDSTATTDGPQPHPYRSGDLPLRDTVTVIDLPSDASVRVGVGLIALGFRPIPLYNAVPSPLAVVELRPIMAVLVNAVERLSTIPPGAPPAFLLDANRMSGGSQLRPGVFDNRSVCRESDFPSAESLWGAGIRRALLIQSTGDRPAADLEWVLATWQKRGIALWRKSTTDAGAAAPFTLTRRSWLSRLIWAARRSFLRRRADDAYGMIVPQASGG